MKHRLFGLGARIGVRALCATGTYQPVVLGGRTIARGHRGTHERYEALLEVLREAEVSTVIDHGCAEGYMVRRLAEAGSMAIGVDDNVRALTTAHLSMIADGVDGWGLMRLTLNEDTVKQLPTVDATISLSVMHHVMYTHGVDYAARMMAGIRCRTRKVLIFEMGQSNETAFDWSSRLPDMGNDPHDWVAEFLTATGFCNVRRVGTMRSFNSDVERAMFAAQPPGA